jgi:RNA polymerase sigma factor (sigma-70 family)
VSDTDSVSTWIGLLRRGDAKAAQRLWERYFHQMVELAHARLRGRHQVAADEEDVALDAFARFCRSARLGRFPDLNDRHGLWKLLIVMTCQNVTDLCRAERAQKRLRRAPWTHADIEAAISREPTPALAAQVTEECQQLLSRLTDPQLRSIAVWKLEGYSNAEIAAQLACVERTVGRKLNRIRNLWQQ